MVEIEQEISLSSVPAAARDQIRKEAGKGKVVMVESITKDNSIVAYEAHIRTGRKHSEVKVTPEGRLVDETN